MLIVHVMGCASERKYRAVWHPSYVERPSDIDDIRVGTSMNYIRIAVGNRSESLGVMESKARSFLLSKYPAFSQQKERLTVGISILPWDPETFLVFFYHGRIAEPYWMVRMDADGKVSSHESGLLVEGHYRRPREAFGEKFDGKDMPLPEGQSD
jgi:hypothetical protein